jgi:predicted DNA-binding transcriptional regulator AlpA
MATSTVWAKVKSGKFPAPYKIDGMTCWTESQLDAWITAKISEARSKPATPLTLSREKDAA